MDTAEPKFLDNKSLGFIRSNLVSHVKICAFIGEIDNGIPKNILVNDSKKLVKIPCLLCDTVNVDIRTNDLVKLCGQFLLREIEEDRTELFFSVKNCRVVASFGDPLKIFGYFSQKTKTKIENLSRNIRSRTPSTYYRIGVITIGIEENGTVIENFQRMFQEKCTGSLYTYRADPTNANHTIISGMELFCNYYDIDLIIIFPADATIETGIMLSSKKIVSYLYHQQKNNRKKPIPYLVGLDIESGARTSMFHIYRELCNATFTIPKCIEFIQNSQITRKENIETYMEWGLFHINKQIDELRDTLLDLELRFVSMGFDSAGCPKENADIFTKTQDALHSHLAKNMEILDKIQFDMMSNVLEDSHIQCFLSASLE